MATKTYKKFLTGAATAAMVVSAVAPVAAATNTEVAQSPTFVDVVGQKDYADDVYEAKSLGFVHGYVVEGEGLVFRPHATLTRSDAVKMFAKYILAKEGLTFDQYSAKYDLNSVENFEDLPDTYHDGELVNFSKIVKREGIFEGVNNYLNPKDKMRREQMASTIVRAFELEGDGVQGNSDLTDLATASATHREAIEILRENKVTNQTEFAPKNPLKRGQFATMLMRGYKVFNNLDPYAPLPEGWDPTNPGTEQPEPQPEPGEELFDGLTIETSKGTLVADGRDNMTVTFKITDAEGNVDTSVDNLVLKLDTTHGAFASNIVTVQDGVATAQLTSESSKNNLTARITAIVDETSVGYEDYIGEAVAYKDIVFTAPTGEENSALTVLSAETNQADRVVLKFDREFKFEDLVNVDSKGNPMYDQVSADGTVVATGLSKAAVAGLPADEVRHSLRDVDSAKSIVINQGNTEYQVQGILPDANDPTKVEVVLDDDSTLNNLDEVQVVVNHLSETDIKTVSDVEFKITDARDPQATNVTNSSLKDLQVHFSEAIDEDVAPTFTIDGQYGNTTFTPVFGEFDPRSLTDERHIVTLELNSNYKEPGGIAGYLTAGNHKVSVTGYQDYAGNEGNTQDLSFTVAPNTVRPAAEVDVMSPEQFWVTFNTEVSGNINAYEIQKLDPATGEYVTDDALKGKLQLSKAAGKDKEYVIELTEDWTVHYGTNASGENYYNDKYRLVFKKDQYTNVDNGLTNTEDIILDLNYTGSPLNEEGDDISPVIESVDQWNLDDTFMVTMSEPVKVPGMDNAGDTPSETQGPSVPASTVQFVGTDAAGNPVTIDGTFVKNNADSTDTTVYVKANEYQGDTIQELVDRQFDAFDEDWKVVIRSISDDYGNTASTLSHDFVVKRQPVVSPFKVVDAVGGTNSVTIEFTEGVLGNSAATNVTTYTLNQKPLPKGTVITVSDRDNEVRNGYEYVTLTFPGDGLATGSNIINVSKDLKSYDGSVLEDENEWKFTPVAAN